LAEDKFVLLTPTGTITELAKRFIEAKAFWIQKTWTIAQKRIQQKQQFLEKTWFFGKETKLQFQHGSQTKVRYEANVITITTPHQSEELKRQAIGKALRALGEHYLKNRINTLAEICQVKFNRVTIKSHKSKWGSCSSLKNINLNWYLILLDKATIDYVIIHELMHLHEMNHSKRFWKWVATYYPEYTIAEKRLKEFSWLIGLYE
ncbi:MAG: M48 family metallopeptidase, partial [Bacteroidia bacterium]|nr:M48 family metallopeptidase [Bacteroidia bacterium]